MTINSINQLSELSARNKLVPFLGAGASYGHLLLDWDSISKEMDSEISTRKTSNIDIAEEYVSLKGNEGLCAFLKGKLIVNEYNENKDIVPLVVLSLGVGLIYTTNQDNVFEKCIEKYGRKYRVIKSIEDLSRYLPGESIYIKYHGDLSLPDSVIFSKSSYDARIDNKDHFLNIRMRSDLLAKSFLFIGYSFRDPNVCLIFEQLYNAFGGKLPPSYLIAFDYTPDLEILNKQFGVNIINPAEEVSGCKDHVESFEKYMVQLCEETCSKKTSKEIDSLFRPAVPSAIKVVSKYEIYGIESVAKNGSFDETTDMFRATCDISLVPEIYHPRVASILIELCKKCSDINQSDKLSAAIFNLEINMSDSIDVLAAVLTTALHRGIKSGFDIFHPIMPVLHEAAYPFAAARAIELIKEWSIPMNDSFRKHVSGWIEGYNELPIDAQQYIVTYVNWAWSDKTTYENPISYWRRLGHKSSFGKPKTFRSIHNDILSRLPKAFTKPYED